MNKIYTVKEVAKILGRPDSFVRLKIKSGHLKAVPVGRSYRIQEQSLQGFLNYCKQENVEYSHSKAIDGITIHEFRKTINIGLSAARNIIKNLEDNNIIKVVKINNKLILPKDIYVKMGFDNKDFSESKDESSIITTSINATRLFEEDDTLNSLAINHIEPLSTKKVEPNNPNNVLNIVKEIQELNTMLKTNSITQNEFNTLKKALIRKV